jgi:uncharacterized membrane protein
MTDDRPSAIPRSARILPYCLAAGFAVLFAAYSVVRHHHILSGGYDLGIFDQAIRAYAHFKPPIVPIKEPGFNLLGDHFHPVLILLVPFYRLWPDASTLLVAQAVLVAASIIPISRLALTRLGPRRGTAVAVAYGLSWGIQGAIDFDFHEIAFAVPLLAFALVALAEQRWTAAIAWTLPLLLVKEDMGLTVAAIGAYLCWKGRRRDGALLAAAGLATVLITVELILPHINAGGFRYSTYLAGDNPVTALLHLPTGLPAHPRKLVLLVMVAVTTAGAALRSPLLLIGVPGLLTRLVSADPWHWEIGRVHYNAILMPIVFVALLDALPALASSRRRLVRAYGWAAVPATISFALLLQVATWSLLNPVAYRDTERAEAAHRLLRLIPDDARVATSNNLAPQLTSRCDVVIFPPLHGERVEWAIVDTTLRLSGPRQPDQDKAAVLGLWPPTPHQQQTALRALPAEGFTQVAADHGFVLYRHR